MTKPTEEQNTQRWNRKLWLWAVLFALLIFFTAPVARSIQQIAYRIFSKEFFTHAVILVIISVLCMLIYFFVFRLRIKNPFQYIWLLSCAGLYVYVTLMLRNRPEEAVHLLEYGLLTYFIFKALGHRIRDRTIYIAAVLIVSFIGMMDEFIQWILPSRYWSYKDVGINSLSAVIFVLILWKGVRPQMVSRPVNKYSVKILLNIITIQLIFATLCLSNTPSAVNRYISDISPLSWIKKEEPMTEYGHKFKDPEIGILYSRLTLTELKTIDRGKGDGYGKMLHEKIGAGDKYEILLERYRPATNAFLYEFLVHVKQRDSTFENLSGQDLSQLERNRMSNIVLKENILLTKYFSITLHRSGLAWPEDATDVLKEHAPSFQETYESKVGNLITAISLKAVWAISISALLTVWTLGKRWERRLEI